MRASALRLGERHRPRQSKPNPYVLPSPFPHTLTPSIVISASSDGTVKAWNPHSSSSGSDPYSDSPNDPSILGTHADYVRCLAAPRTHGWVASGSFDRTIKLWDVSRAGPSSSHSQYPSQTRQPQPQPLLTFPSPTPMSSVYALSTSHAGDVIASGSPERVVRLWDPRSGKRKTGKLVGHTDNIRAVVVSADGRYVSFPPLPLPFLFS